MRQCLSKILSTTTVICLCMIFRSYGILWWVGNKGKQWDFSQLLAVLWSVFKTGRLFPRTHLSKNSINRKHATREQALDASQILLLDHLFLHELMAVAFGLFSYLSNLCFILNSLFTMPFLNYMLILNTLFTTYSYNFILFSSLFQAPSFCLASWA